VQSAHQPFGRGGWAQWDSPAYAAGLKQILQARISRPVGHGVIKQWVSALTAHSAQSDDRVGFSQMTTHASRRSATPPSLAFVRLLSLTLCLFCRRVWQPAGIYVVPQSDQCYPDYLITFQ
jgi:hypothetical protein